MPDPSPALAAALALYREHVGRDLQPVEIRTIQIIVEPSAADRRGVEAFVAALAEAVESRRLHSRTRGT
jgi:hypothetical protein